MISTVESVLADVHQKVQSARVKFLEEELRSHCRILKNYQHTHEENLEQIKSLKQKNASLKKRNSELQNELSEEVREHLLLEKRLGKIRVGIKDILQKKISKVMRSALCEIYRMTEKK